MHALETSLWHGLTPDMCETQFERSTELCQMHTVATTRFSTPVRTFTRW